MLRPRPEGDVLAADAQRHVDTRRAHRRHVRSRAHHNGLWLLMSGVIGYCRGEHPARLQFSEASGAGVGRRGRRISARFRLSSPPSFAKGCGGRQSGIGRGYLPMVADGIVDAATAFVSRAQDRLLPRANATSTKNNVRQNTGGRRQSCRERNLCGLCDLTHPQFCLKSQRGVIGFAA